jgi:hypothetical protein
MTAIEEQQQQVQSYRYRIKPQIADVLSNKVRIPYFSFGEYLDDRNENDSDTTFDPKISINFEVQKDIPRPEHLVQKFHFFYGDENTDELYYERPLGVGIVAKMHCKNLLREPTIVVNDSYYKFIRSRIDSAYPPGVHVADILTVKLLQRSFSPIHCAAISINGEGQILAAPPDTGKSLTTLLAIRRGYSFLSEDIAIIDDKHVYANPTTATFYHTENFKTSKSMESQIYNLLYLKVPVLSYFLDPPNAKVYDLIQDIKIDEKVPIKNIFILGRGTGGLMPVDPVQAARRLLIINRNEFSYHKNTLLFAHSYFNESLGLENLMKEEECLLSTLANKVKCYLVRTNDPKEYIEFIDKVAK